MVEPWIPFLGLDFFICKIRGLDTMATFIWGLPHALLGALGAVGVSV